MIDMIIPVTGIGLVAFVLLEGCFQVITLNMANFMAEVREILKLFDGETSPEQPSAIAPHTIASVIQAFQSMR